MADYLEVDVHLYRGALEVRHAKVLAGTNRLWERWYLLPADADRPVLDDVLDATDGFPLHLDLKGWRRSLARAVDAMVEETRPLVVSSRWWRHLKQFRGRPDTLRLASAGSAVQRLACKWFPGWVGRLADGVALPLHLADADVVGGLRHHGLEVFVWGVPDLAVARRLESWGVTGVIADDVTLLAHLRRCDVA